TRRWSVSCERRRPGRLSRFVPRPQQSSDDPCRGPCPGQAQEERPRVQALSQYPTRYRLPTSVPVARLRRCFETPGSARLQRPGGRVKSSATEQLPPWHSGAVPAEGLQEALAPRTCSRRRTDESHPDV